MKKASKNRQTTVKTPTDRALIMLNWITAITVILFAGVLILPFLL